MSLVDISESKAPADEEIEQGALGGTAQKVGGPFDKEGAVGKHFTHEGAIGGTAQKLADSNQQH